MKVVLNHLWERLQQSFWFYPTVFATTALLVSLWGRDLNDHLPFLFSFTGSQDLAREVLSLIASSIITVLGVVFSVMIVALSLTSNLYGHRIVYYFTKDPWTKMVLAVFTATFVFSLTTLIFTGNGEISNFNVTVSYGLGLLCLGSLIFFIHHVSSFIQVENVIKILRRQLMFEIETNFIDQNNKPEVETEDEDEFQIGLSVDCIGSGYLQAVEWENLVKVAQKYDFKLKLLVRPGYYLNKGERITLISKDLPVNVKRKISKFFITGQKRTWEQDVEFSILQLTEVATRALSPYSNDSYTVVQCLYQLTDPLKELCWKVPKKIVCDSRKEARIYLKTYDFKDYLSLCLDEIRQNAGFHVPIYRELLITIGKLAHKDLSNDRINVLEDYLNLIRASYQSKGISNEDLVELDAKYLKEMQKYVMRKEFLEAS